MLLKFTKMQGLGNDFVVLLTGEDAGGGAAKRTRVDATTTLDG